MSKKFLLETIAIIMLIHLAMVLRGQFINMNYVLQNNYAATRNGKTIGWLRTTSSQDGNERSLTTESNLTIRMLISFEAKAITVNKFKGNTLIQAGVYRTLNGREKLDNELQLTDGKYKIIKGDAEPLTRPIVNTVVSIYFKEPVGITEVFSEVYLCFIQLKKIAPSIYQSLLPDGGIMTYSYTLGKLTHITAKTSYGTLQFDLKQ